MELSAKARQKAVEAFKQELTAGVLVLRKNLAEDVIKWNGKEHKMLLHRLKGGAGFLGYNHLNKEIADLESKALTYPSDPKSWVKILDSWEAISATLS